VVNSQNCTVQEAEHHFSNRVDACKSEILKAVTRNITEELGKLNALYHQKQPKQPVLYTAATCTRDLQEIMKASAAPEQEVAVQSTRNNAEYKCTSSAQPISVCASEMSKKRSGSTCSWDILFSEDSNWRRTKPIPNRHRKTRKSIFSTK